MIDLLRHIREQSDCLASAAEQHPGASVPACPGWTVADVAAHVGRVHRLFTEVVRSGLLARPGTAAEAPTVPALPGWVRSGADDLLRALTGADPDRPVWNWTGTPAPPAWVRRRMAHETAVHRWDADSALAGAESAPAGAEPAPVPADLAPDGIDEFLDVILEHRTEPWTGPAVAVALARADGPERWIVRTARGRPGVEVSRGGALAADVTARAGASDLLLVLWRRIAPVEVEGEGAGDALGRLLTWPRL